MIASASRMRTLLINVYFPTPVDKPWFFMIHILSSSTLFWNEVLKPGRHLCMRLIFARN